MDRRIEAIEFCTLLMVFTVFTIKVYYVAVQ